ncbi:ABC transporter permease [Actinomyces trachealis]|uniref:ABC transporter permease n=1 Tax=Actinomyces trachealis TaxID=2763540 RepID=UPI001892A87B|nr:ABC transporter permease [Actinomyces trachealis]
MSLSAIRTVAVLELRQRVRSTRWRVMLVMWAIILILVTGGLSYLAGAYNDGTNNYAPPLYDLIVCFVLGIGLVVAPTLSASSVNGDRADATLALLQATALRSREIVVGKLVAAWLAVLAFLAIAMPFLVTLMVYGGTSKRALIGHVLVLVVTLGAVCAVGLGCSAATARPSASTVLTYLVVAALVVGTPLTIAVSSPLVRSEQEQVTYKLDYANSTSQRQVCLPDPEVTTTRIMHEDRIWWVLAANPFVALGDISLRAPGPAAGSTWLSWSPLTVTGVTVNDLRRHEPEQVVVNPCGPGSVQSMEAATVAEAEPHLRFWPATLGIMLFLALWATVSASRALRTPVRKLHRGTRIA